MPNEPTIPQGGQERRQSKEMSLKRGRPPTQVPGYEAERFLGMGAYGEVWVALQNNTGRRVAIKFYAHRGGLDWSLLSREVEKLAFLFADRYVVQLIGVGWDAEPPYYIMEYLEQGSLAERLEEGPLPVREAVDLFHDVAMGLVHAHGKGVLHCDLKPANILLDQDGKPRLADFGQARLSHEQAPALGTLFYMAPEQADMEAVPDSRWDVYALGAVMYCMLTGRPPHRDHPDAGKLDDATDLGKRLATYRRMIRRAPRPRAHRQVPGVDGDLAEIVDRCLAADPQKRYPNVQAVLDALEARRARIARRPVMVFGTLGPVLLLAVVLGLVWWGSSRLMSDSRAEFLDRAMASTDFAAEFGGRGLQRALEQRYNVVTAFARSEKLQDAMAALHDDAQLNRLLKELDQTPESSAGFEPLRKRFVEHPDRRAVQEALGELTDRSRLPESSGWFLTDSHGVQIARWPEKPGREKTIGKNFSWRSYFHGGKLDQGETWRPSPSQHVAQTQLSAFYRSQATGRWMTTVSAPIFDNKSPGRPFLGILGLMVDANQFDELKRTHGQAAEPSGPPQQFYAIVDWRDGPDKGRIVQHDLYDRLIEFDRLARHGKGEGRLPQKYLAEKSGQKEGEAAEYCLARLPEDEEKENYTDPLADDEDGKDYQGRWLASAWHVVLYDKDKDRKEEEEIPTDLVVLAQTNYETAIGHTLKRLGTQLLLFGMLATVSMIAVIVGLWGLAFRLMNRSGMTRRALGPGDWGTQRPSASTTPRGGSSASPRSDPTAATELLPPAHGGHPNPD